VQVDDVLVDIEAEKCAGEICAPVAGKLIRFNEKLGQE